MQCIYKLYSYNNMCIACASHIGAFEFERIVFGRIFVVQVRQNRPHYVTFRLYTNTEYELDDTIYIHSFTKT